MNELIIIGAGGHGLVAYEIALNTGLWDAIYFCDDNLDSENNKLVIGNISYALNLDSDKQYFVAIGNNKLRRELIQELLKLNKKVVTLIHNKAIISSSATIDLGSIVAAGVVVGPKVKIGVGTIINTCASIDHECKIADFVHISPGVIMAGNVTVGENCWICSGTTIINNIIINRDCVIGAGSLVLKSIIEPGKYYGSPVKKIGTFI